MAILPEALPPPASHPFPRCVFHLITTYPGTGTGHEAVLCSTAVPHKSSLQASLLPWPLLHPQSPAWGCAVMASSQSWWDECIADLRPMRPGWHRAVSNYQTGTKAEKPYPDLLKKHWSALALSSRDGLITLGLERKA